MNQDDRLTKRNPPVPVTVRRTDPPTPATTQSVAAPAAPHIIYIDNRTMPAVAPASPPPPMSAPPAAVVPPPATINHYHATQHTTHRISYRIPVMPSNSTLGLASLALGVIACVVCWVPWLGLVAVPVGAIGAVLGVLGVLVSLLFRKSSAGLPLTAVFICCLAAGISVVSTRSLPYWEKQLKIGWSTVASATSPSGTSSLPSASPLLPLPAKTIAAPNIFDSSPPAVAQQAKPLEKSVAAKPQAAVKVDPSIVAAINQLGNAEKGCDARTRQTPEYLTAEKIAAEARAHNTALQDAVPGSSDQLDAGRALIDADNAASAILTRAQASDPDVIAARQALTAARAK